MSLSSAPSPATWAPGSTRASGRTHLGQGGLPGGSAGRRGRQHVDAGGATPPPGRSVRGDGRVHPGTVRVPGRQAVGSAGSGTSTSIGASTPDGNPACSSASSPRSAGPERASEGVDLTGVQTGRRAEQDPSTRTDRDHRAGRGADDHQRSTRAHRRSARPGRWPRAWRPPARAVEAGPPSPEQHRQEGSGGDNGDKRDEQSAVAEAAQEGNGNSNQGRRLIPTVNPLNTTDRPAVDMAATTASSLDCGPAPFLPPAGDEQQRVVDGDAQADERDQVLDDLAHLGDRGHGAKKEEGGEDRDQRHQQRKQGQERPEHQDQDHEGTDGAEHHLAQHPPPPPPGAP